MSRIRKNKKFIDPRYFMDEKMETLTEAEVPGAEAESQDSTAPEFWQLSLPGELPPGSKQAIQSKMHEILQGANIRRLLRGLGAKYGGEAAHDGSGRTLSERGVVPTFMFYTTPQTDQQQYSAGHDKIGQMLKSEVGKLFGRYESLGIDRDTAREYLGQMQNMSWTPTRGGGN